MINSSLMLLLATFLSVPAFAGQHVSVRPRTAIDPGDQETIREIVEMERQAKEASLRRDAEFPQRTLADGFGGSGASRAYQRSRLYLKMHHSARNPSFHPIFLPCSYVRP